MQEGQPALIHQLQRVLEHRIGFGWKACDDVGPEHRQVVAGIREINAVENLQTGAQPCGFEVKLAQALALTQLIADEECLPIKAAADRLELRINPKRLQIR